MVSLTAIEDTMTALKTAISIGLILPFSTIAHAEGDVFSPPNHSSLSDFDTSALPKESISRPLMGNGLPHHVEVRLIADHLSIAPGIEVQLSIRMTVNADSHLS